MTVFRLLVVEDDPELRSQLSRGLGEAGFVVEAVGDAAAAMARTGDMPDGLVIDIGLPTPTGATSARRCGRAASTLRCSSSPRATPCPIAWRASAPGATTT